jgi:O-antigen/teichoic acid export membrane protein
LNVLLSLALIPPFGLIGAAIATAFSTIAWNLAALVFVRRKLGVNPTILPMASR